MASREAVSNPAETITTLYRAHAAYVWKSARRLGVPASEVEDVVQETFLRAHQILDSYEPRGADRSWLFAILYRVVLHHRRALRVRAAHTEVGVNMDVLPGAATAAPDRNAEARETVRVLEHILDGLEPERRAVLVLSELEERKVPEIAEILGINVNTATSRLRLAREAVETAMARHRARDGWRSK